jgi:hypothetical protein
LCPGDYFREFHERSQLRKTNTIADEQRRLGGGPGAGAPVVKFHPQFPVEFYQESKEKSHMRELTLEEAREMAVLTDRIVSNLKVINADPNTDLDELEKTTSSICNDLRTINTDPNIDLDELEKQTAKIVAGLREIANAKTATAGA